MWPFSGGSTVDAARGSAEASIALPRGPPAGVDLSNEAAAADACPVDDVTRNAWLAQARQRAARGEGGSAGENDKTNAALAFLSVGESIAAKSTPTSSDGTITVNRNAPRHDLSTDRVVSSIPRFGASAAAEAKATEPAPASTNGGHAAAVDPAKSANWVYPSPAQFFNAMARKNHNPEARDMDVVVPIHNAVNERAWGQILAWERAADPESFNKCGGPQLVSFKGRPKDVTWHAWTRSLFGYHKPFDRHDWEVDRCGRRIKYVIDFYSGHTTSGPNSLSFYLDVRPSPADLEGIRMRIMRFFTRPPPPPAKSA